MLDFEYFCRVKWCLHIVSFLFGLAMLMACSKHAETPRSALRQAQGPQTHELSQIDTLMWHHPDSALAVMLEFAGSEAADSLDVFEGHYCQVLIAELLYKNDSLQANRMELLQAMNYFDSLCGNTDIAHNVSTIAFLDARSHYMYGVGYYENDSAVEACKEYMKALEVMENNFEEKELVGYKAKFMALTYTRLTSLFSKHYLHDQTIYFANLSLPYYDSKSWSLVWIMNEIGSHYDMKDQIDSADYYYLKALETLNDTNSLIYRDISTHRIYLNYKTEKSTEEAIAQMKRLLSESQSLRESNSRCLTIGEIYYHEHQFDSAWIYLNKVYLGNTSTDAKKQAAEWLVEICKAQGREADIMEYADFLVPFANKEENQSAIKSQLTELYNTFRQGVLERQHQRIVRKNAQWTAMAIGVLCIIIFAIICFYYKNKRRLLLLESQKPEEPPKAQDRLLAFMEEPVCQEIIQSIQGQNIKRLATPKAFPELVLTDAQLQQLSLLATRYFGPMDLLLEKHDLKAKPALVNLCHLYLLGMDEKQAAILLNRDYSSVKRYEKTLKTAFNTQQNMVAFMRNMVLSP